MFEQSTGFHRYLTDYAQSLYANPEEDLDLHRLLFPAVKVGSNTGRFDKYDIHPALTSVNTILARDGSPRRIQLDRRPAYWDCEPNALEICNFKPDLLQDDADIIKEDEIRTLMSAHFTGRKVMALEKVRAAVPAVQEAGKWGEADADPIEDIDTLCRAVSLGCGRTPNTLLMGVSAWAALRRHAAVLARVHGIAVDITPQTLADMLTYKGLTIHIAPTMASVKGEMQELLAKDLLVFYREDAPTRSDMSFGKEFTLSPNGPEVLEYEEKSVNVVDSLLWSSDTKVVNASALSRLEIQVD